jgi:hypothetical protein
VLFGNIGGFIGISENPTASNFIAIHPGIGKISPWVF